MMCDCDEVCGWSFPHTTESGECELCGTEMIEGQTEFAVSFKCDTHGEMKWTR